MGICRLCLLQGSVDILNRFPYNLIRQTKKRKVCDYMKKLGLWVVILYGVSAVIWTIRSILDFVMQAYNDSLFLVVLNVLCAVVWIAGFIIHLRRYRSHKGEQ